MQNTTTGPKRIGADVCSPMSPPSVCCRRWVPGGSGESVESHDSCQSISARDSGSPREWPCGAVSLNEGGRETFSSLTRRRPCGRTDTSRFWRARFSPPWRPTDRSLTSRTRYHDICVLSTLDSRLIINALRPLHTLPRGSSSGSR